MASAVTFARTVGLTLLDVLLATSVALSILIILTGGTEAVVGTHRISIRSVTNPLLAAAVLFAARFALRRAAPFLGISSLRLDRVEWRCLALATSSLVWLRRQRDTPLAVIAALLIVCVFFLKLANAIWYRGFYSGDDVEIHEMTLGSLLGLNWPVWEVRSPFYPMLFIYPAQAAVLHAGHAEMDYLVFAGRAVVIIISTGSLWLTYTIARDLGGHSAVGVIAVLFYGFSRLHITYGSSELPRPVAAFFLLISFGLLLKPGVARTVAAGMTLAIAASLRFSEFIFFIPAALQLGLYHSWRLTGAFIGAGSVAAVIITGLADWLYWGYPWQSVEHIVRYTLVDQLSSRGYQPWHWYFTNLFRWTNPLVVGLAVYGTRLPHTGVHFWIWIPIVLLSLLPHKETRYVVTIVPFLSIAAAASGWHLWHRLIREAAASRARRAAVGSLLLLATSLGSFLLEAGGFRFRERSPDPIAIAKHVARVGGAQTVAAEQAWRAGANLYLPKAEVIDLDPDKIAEWAYLCSRVAPSDVRWLWLRRHRLSARRMTALRTIGYIPDERIDPSSYMLFQRLGPTQDPVCHVEE